MAPRSQTLEPRGPPAEAETLLHASRPVSPVDSDSPHGSRKLVHRYDQISIHHQSSESVSAPAPSLIQDSTEKDEQDEQDKPLPGRELQRSSSTLILVIVYTALALFLWTVICVLVYRPITIAHYGVSLRGSSPYKSYDYTPRRLETRTAFQKSEKWFRAARVIQAVLAILTIPITSYVCAKAAVVFVQNSRSRLTIRQTLVLADKGWASPDVWQKLVLGGVRKLGSSFLAGAIVLNLLGGVISPLQSIFLTTRSISTPLKDSPVYEMTDILDLINHGSARVTDDNDRNFVPLQVREAVTTTNILSPQPRLWTGGSSNCTSSSDQGEWCSQGSITLDTLDFLLDPFVAQLPSGYDTGLIRQYLPRINSSVSRETIDAADFPSDCQNLPGAFYARYGYVGNSSYSYNWSMIVCMPSNQTHSPWKASRDRQDFSEELYMNITLRGMGYYDDSGGTYRIIANTTAGYFELPNYMNGMVPQPLLDDDPVGHCGHDCIPQGFPNFSQWTRRAEAGGQPINETSQSTGFLQNTRNRGPLLTVAIALFGEGSFIQQRVENPENFIAPVDTYAEFGILPALEPCTELTPFISLLQKSNGGLTAISPGLNDISICVAQHDATNMNSLQAQLTAYVALFWWNYWGDWQIEKAWRAAVFLANEAWLLSALNPSLIVSYDAGAQTLVPQISLVGMVVISVLLAVYLAMLIALAVYSTWRPMWSQQLDAFAMMRFGVAVVGQAPLLVGEADALGVLDEVPGWIGDTKESEAHVGELVLGGLGPVSSGRKFACYPNAKGGGLAQKTNG